MIDWKQKMFFDNELNLSNCRYSQAELAYKKVIDYDHWFTKPWPEINGKLYSHVWMVGSGKTLAIPMTAFAINYALRRNKKIDTPRVKSLLVLVKERSLRNQLSVNLTNELFDRKICMIKPRVKNISSGRFFDNLDNIDDYDICVSCTQQLWDRKNGRQDLTDILDRFQLIAIDEPHFAAKQTNEIVKKAKCPVFGFTGTPFDSEGVPIKNQVVVSFYDYNQANKYDHSLKHISSDLADYLKIIEIKNADIQEGDKTYQTQNANIKGYDIGIPPMQAVAESVIEHLSQCDFQSELEIQQKIIASHRKDYEHKWSGRMINYPAHGIICVADKKTAATLEDNINNLLENSRSRFPLEKGWIVSVAMSGDHPGEKTKKNKILPLDSNHPWNVAKNNDGKFVVKKGKKQINGSRILILVGMGKEGLDNPYCNTLGIACSKSSQQELPQRQGRTFRSAHKLDADGRLILPPKILDTPKIITHATYFDKNLYEFTHNFLTDMRSFLTEMTDIEQLVDGCKPLEFGVVDSESLSDQERMGIADLICQKINQKEKIDSEFVNLISNLFGGDNEKKQKKVEEWIDIVDNNPREACNRLHLREKLSSIPAVLREEQDRKISEDDLIEWGRSKLDGDLSIGSARDTIIKILRSYYEEHFDKFKLPPTRYITDIEEIREEIRSDIFRSIQYMDKMNNWGMYVDEQKRNILLKNVPTFVNAAVKQIIGTDNSVNKGGDYDKPQYHAIFFRPHVVKSIKGFVFRALAKNSYLGNLRILIDREENQ